MNTERVERIANAVLYEGYMLYPYRPTAVKNRQRFNFGVIYPQACIAAQPKESLDADRSFLQTECLVRGDGAARISVRIRFLHLVDRLTERPERTLTWQEAVERDITLDAWTLGELTASPLRRQFTFPVSVEAEPLREGNETVGTIVRRQRGLNGEIVVTAERWADDVARVRVVVSNSTDIDDVSARTRDGSLLHAFVSAHVILGLEEGEFVSLLDPPEELAGLAERCENLGVWPVLAGEAPARDVILSSPIILYDYPELAPESAGDLFDGTEIDELLSLRIMTLTDAEKDEMRLADEHARRILERTESLSAEQLMGMHGTMRRPRTVPGEEA
jgi:hydrogenase maturation protease